MKGGITLGKYIVVHNHKYIKHEYGHTIKWANKLSDKYYKN